MQELKNLVAKDFTSIGAALKKTFDLLNQFRLQTGIDNYGQVISFEYPTLNIFFSKIAY